MSQIKAVVYYPDDTRDKAIAKINQPTAGYASLSTFSNKLTLDLAQVPTSIKVLIKNRGTSGKVLYDGLSVYIPDTEARAATALTAPLIPLPEPQPVAPPAN